MVGLKRFATASLAATALAHPAHQNSKRAVAVGVNIEKCTVPGTVALTFDDGPSTYTSQLIDTLGVEGHKATFFVNGQNYGSILDNKDLLIKMTNAGHQLGTHTCVCC
jgi:peptidoglycan/xylan/chitin deacetylase (PgdA/CDA1 family)